MVTPGQPSQPRSALWCLDQGWKITRGVRAHEFAMACLPGALIAWVLLSLYYVERVEGVRFLRPLVAILLVLGFGLRAVVLGRWAMERARTYASAGPGRDGTPALELGHASITAALRGSFWMGLNLWCWLWPLVVVLRVDLWLLPLLIPLWCVRGALAPSWLIVVCTGSQTSTTGLRRIVAAIAHAKGQRAQALLAELLLLLGSAAWMVNLGALMSFAVTLAQSSLGFNLSSVRAFVSPQNHFMLLCVGAASVVVMEPMRASLSAILYVDAELARDGKGVRALVERAVASSPKRRHERVGRSAGVLLMLLQILQPRAHAAPPESDPEALLEAESAANVDELCDESCTRARARDDAWKARVRAILSEPEFAEFPDDSWSIDQKGALRRWFEKLFDDWFREATKPPRPTRPQSSWNALPGGAFFLTVGVLLLMLALARLSFGGTSRRTKIPIPPKHVAAPDPLACSSEEHFAEAVRLFERSPREALRSVYLGALVGLSQKDLVQLAPARSNGNYLQQLAGREERSRFRELTRVFDATQYGEHPVTPPDFQRCLDLARDLARVSPNEPVGVRP